MFNSIDAAINYLKSLDSIIIPTQFTYFNHCTSYIPKQYRDGYNKKIWNEIPTKSFEINGEMSFTERDTRIKEALRHGGAHKAHIQYGIPSRPHVPFIVRVIIPKLNSGLKLSSEYKNQLEKIYNGYGDKRHPKLASGEKIFIFASSTKDEVSDQNIDILYGIREKDVILYANIVWLNMLKSNSYPNASMPKVTEITKRESYGGIGFELITTDYEFDDDFEFNHHTYSIPKDKTLSKYEDFKILDQNHNIQATMESLFETQVTKPKSR